MHILNIKREHGKTKSFIKLVKLSAVHHTGSKRKLWLELTQIKTTFLNWQLHRGLAVTQPGQIEEQQVN